MTIGSNTPSQVEYTGGPSAGHVLDGSKTRFNITFPRFSQDDVVISFFDKEGNEYSTTNNGASHRESPFGLIISYVIEDILPSTGIATLVIDGDITALNEEGRVITTKPLESGTIHSDYTLVISFREDPVQPATFREGSRVTADNLEKGLDRLTLAQKQMSDEVNTRSIRMPKNAPDGFDPVLKGRGDINTSTLDSIKDRFLQVNEDGDGIEIGVHERDIKGAPGVHATEDIFLYFSTGKGSSFPTIGDSSTARGAVATAIGNKNIKYDSDSGLGYTVLPASGVRIHTDPEVNLPTGSWIYSAFPPSYDSTTNNLFFVRNKIVFETTDRFTEDITIRLLNPTEWSGPFQANSLPAIPAQVETNKTSIEALESKVGEDADRVPTKNTILARVYENEHDIDGLEGKVGDTGDRIVNGKNTVLARVYDNEQKIGGNRTQLASIKGTDSWDDSIDELSTGVPANLKNIAAELKSDSSDLFNNKLREAGVESGITRIENELGSQSEDPDGVGTIYKRIDQARKSGEGGSGGVTPAELDDLKKKLTPTYARLLESDDPDRQNPASSFAGRVEGFNPVTNLSRDSGSFDLVVSKRDTTEGQEVPRSGTFNAFGDSLKTYNSGTGMVDISFPAANSLKFFRSVDTRLNVERIDINTGQFVDESSQYPVQCFVAYTRGLGKLGIDSILGKPNLQSTMNLDDSPVAFTDSSDSRISVNFTREESWGPLGNRDPYTLRCVDNGVEVRCAIVFYIPKTQPYHVPDSSMPENRVPLQFRDSGYIGVFIEGATHNNLRIKFGLGTDSSGSEKEFFLNRKPHGGTTFISDDPQGPGGLDRVPIPYYEGRLGDFTMKELFGGNAITSNGYTRNGVQTNPAVTSLSNNGLTLSTRLAILSMENNLNIEQHRLETATTNIVTAEKLSLDSLISLIDIRTADLINESPPDPVQYVRRHRYVQFYAPTSGRPLDLSSTKTINTDIPDDGFAAHTLQFWKSVESVHLYISLGSTLSGNSWDNGPAVGIFLLRENISQLVEALDAPGASSTQINKVYQLTGFMDAGSGNTNYLLDVRFRSIGRSFEDVRLGLQTSRDKNSGNYARYLQRGMAVEERYIDSRITNWYREVGLNTGNNPTLRGNNARTNSIDVDGQTVSMPRGFNIITVDTHNSLLDKDFNLTDRANEIITYINGYSSGGFDNYLLGFFISNRCTIDVLMNNTTRQTAITEIQLIRISSSGQITTLISRNVGASTIPPANNERFTAEVGDRFVFIHNSTSTRNFSLFNTFMRIQAFAL